MSPRKEAFLRGDKTYHDIKSCKVCGSHLKYVSSYQCISCSVSKLNDDKLMENYRTSEKQLTKLRNWRASNYNKYSAQWLNPEGRPYRNAKSAKRRADQRKQTPEDANLELIQEIYRQCKEISEKTGVPHEVDHIIPIAKGGLHHQDNLQIITAKENRMKGAKVYV